jgi:predicted ATP-binding protein involved in virulence
MTARVASELATSSKANQIYLLSSDVESLRKGKLKSNNKAQGPYTILLVGETGVGKSSVLEFIANVLLGNDIDNYDFDILDHENEAGGSDQESQTNSARHYTLCSNNGVEVSPSFAEICQQI